MSSSLKNSADLAKAGWFGDLVGAAIAEAALAHPANALARSLVRDPGFLLTMFVRALADNPTISADGWAGRAGGAPTDWQSAQDDIRTGLLGLWPLLAGAVPNIQPIDARVPVLDADPDVSSAVSIWIVGTSLRVRGDDGQVREVGVV